MVLCVGHVVAQVVIAATRAFILALRAPRGQGNNVPHGAYNRNATLNKALCAQAGRNMTHMPFAAARRVGQRSPSSRKEVPLFPEKKNANFT